MFHVELTSTEKARVRVEYEYTGFPRQPICARPKAVRQFCKRIEVEMRRKGVLH